MSILTGNRIRYAALGLILVLISVRPETSRIKAQEPAVFGQHLYNRMLYNPAFAGDRAIPGVTFLTRQQWMSWEGSPSANLLSTHTRLKDKNASAGIILGYDRMGPVHYTGLTGLYSYTLNLGAESRLHLGLQGEIRFLQIRVSTLQLVDQGDPLYADDPGLKPQPNAGIGARYVKGNLQLHVAIPRILNSALTPFEGETSRWSKARRVLYLGAAWNQQLNEDLSVDPSLLLAFSGGRSPFAEVAALFHYRKMVSLGAFYRFNKTLGGSIRYNHQQRFVFGYSYDLALGKLRNNVGTHELFLGYNFPFNRTKTLSPRRF